MLPVPDTNVNDGRTVRAEGPLAGLAELTGQQLAAPPLDGTTAFAATIAKIEGPNLDWLAFTGDKAPTALDFSATNEQLSRRYPSARLPVARQVLRSAFRLPRARARERLLRRPGR